MANEVLLGSINVLTLKRQQNEMLHRLIFLVAVVILISDRAIADRNIIVDKLHIKSDVYSRFSSTIITCSMRNSDFNTSFRSATFQFQIPDWAYITNFSTTIDGVTKTGTLEDAQTANREFLLYKIERRSISITRKTGSELEYEIAAMLPSNKSVDFTISYQGMLTRKNGVYTHTTYLPLSYASIPTSILYELSIIERGMVKNVSVAKTNLFKNGAQYDRDLVERRPQSKVQQLIVYSGQESRINVRYSTSRLELGPVKFDQVIKVFYNVENQNDGGEIQVLDGYFVHFFSPKSLPVGSKNVVFLFDKHCSSYRLQQIKTALTQMLTDMNANDYFNLLAYGEHLEQWQSTLKQASTIRIQDASRLIHFISEDNSDFGLNDGFTKAFQLLNNATNEPVVSMIILMTDGIDSEIAIQRYKETSNLISRLNTHNNISVHCLQFGDQSNFELLRHIADANRGIARKVVDEFDAEVQVSGFFSKLSSVALSNVRIEYLNNTINISSLVSNNLYEYYTGDEVVTVGMLNQDAHTSSLATFVSKVKGHSSKGNVSLVTTAHVLQCPQMPIITDDENIEPCCLTFPHCRGLVSVTPARPPWTVAGFIERMWAYKTIQKLLKEEKQMQSPIIKRAMIDRARELSLKYHFITELTSIITIFDVYLPQTATPDPIQNAAGRPTDASVVITYKPDIPGSPEIHGETYNGDNDNTPSGSPGGYQMIKNQLLFLCIQSDYVDDCQKVNEILEKLWLTFDMPFFAVAIIVIDEKCQVLSVIQTTLYDKSMLPEMTNRLRSIDTTSRASFKDVHRLLPNPNRLILSGCISYFRMTDNLNVNIIQRVKDQITKYGYDLCEYPQNKT